MFAIPYPLRDGGFGVFIVLRDDNIEQMKTYDPIELEPKKFGPPFDQMELRAVQIGYCTAEEEKEMVSLPRHEVRNFLKKLTRGIPPEPKKDATDDNYKNISAKPDLN